MSGFYLFEAQPCDRFAFEDAVEAFDPNVLPIVGPAGPQGPQGPQGPSGEYSPTNPPPYPVTSVDGKTGAVVVLPTGGASGQVLKKRSADNYDAEWGDEAAGPTLPLSVANGGTGANNAADARENLGITGISMLFGEEQALTVTAPTGITLLTHELKGQVTADGKFLRIRGVLHMFNPNDVAYIGQRDFTVSGITVTPPAQTVALKGVGFRQYSYNGQYDTIDWSTINDFVNIVVDTSGNIKLQLRIEFGNVNTTSQYFVFPFIIPLA